MSFTVGTLVKARGREWVVLPESKEDFLVVRPLGGTDAEVAGIDIGLETVAPASFDLPNPARLGDFQSCRMLRDAIRLGFRSSAGPFRSFGKIAVEPRPYQLVPLLMALKLDPVRLLIADDVGIGKTVESLLIAKELLDRAEVQRMSVLCLLTSPNSGRMSSVTNSTSRQNLFFPGQLVGWTESAAIVRCSTSFHSPSFRSITSKVNLGVMTLFEPAPNL